MVVPRQQIIPFTVLPGREVDLSFNTKYDHDKVVGVVLMPDKNVHDDTIYLEINRETILPRGFNAGLIAFRSFLNKDIKRNTYSLEEWARGSNVRVVYKNNNKRSVNIDMILYTTVGDVKPITKRKKIQIVPVPFVDYDSESGIIPKREPSEVRTKTDFYYQELIGVFIDYYETRSLQPDSNLYRAGSTLKETIEKYLDFYQQYESEGKTTAITEKAQELQEILENNVNLVVFDYAGNVITALLPYSGYVIAMKDSLTLFFSDAKELITIKNLTALQNAVDENRFEYYDNHKSLSTFELNVGGVPIYPEKYHIATIAPRYRKTFNETMYQTEMQVCEADIFMQFKDLLIEDQEPWTTWFYYQTVHNVRKNQVFSVYFLYNQISKTRINL